MELNKTTNKWVADKAQVRNRHLTSVSDTATAKNCFTHRYIVTGALCCSRYTTRINTVRGNCVLNGKRMRQVAGTLGNAELVRLGLVH